MTLFRSFFSLSATFEFINFAQATGGVAMAMEKSQAKDEINDILNFICILQKF